MASNQFSFDRAFKEQEDYTEFVFKTYDEIYDLPLISKEFEVSESFLKKIRKKKRFILLAPYNKQGEVFLSYHYNSSVSLSLIGGSIHRTETIYDALKRTMTDLGNIQCSDVEPIATVRHLFKGTSSTFIQEGVVFAVRVLNKKAIFSSSTEGDFFPISAESLGQINKLTNKEVLLNCKARFEQFVTEFPESEVSVNARYKHRYAFHNSVVKKFFLTNHLKRKTDFEKMIQKELGSAKKILDVSCGENRLLTKLAPNLSFAVGNDISWSQVEFLLQENNYLPILYTNHNASYLPFKENSFDYSLCMNTLHHMQSKDDLLMILESMFTVSKNILIVEIEDPTKTGWFPKWLNRCYYQGFLKDVGVTYLEETHFRNIINQQFKNRAKIKFANFRNIQGNYLIAKINKGD